MEETTSDERANDELTTLFRDPADRAAVRDLADAERAVVQHEASAEQAAGVAAAGAARSPADRVRAWRAATGG